MVTGASSITAPVAADRKEAPGEATSSALVPAVMACLTLAVVHVVAETYAPLTARLLGWCLGCIAILAAARYLHLGLWHRLPFPEFGLAQAYLVWGLPTVTGSLRRGFPVSREGIVSGASACVLFVLVALVAGPVGRFAARRLSRLSRRALPANPPTGGTWFFPLWLGLAAAVHTGVLRALPTAIRYPVFIIAGIYGVLAYLGHQSRGPRAIRQVGQAALVFAAAGMVSGMLIAVIVPLAAAALLLLMKRRQLPWRWIVGGALLFAFLNPAKHVFRAQQNWQSYDKTKSGAGIGRLVANPTDAASDWFEAIRMTWGGEVDLDQSSDAAIDRFNDLSPIVRTVEFTGRRVPYNRGEQWKLMPLSFVPRFIFPEKPDFTVEFNDRFNLAFGIKEERTMRNSTFSFPVIADGYWNFGWVGVAVVGFVIGFYWSFVANLWSAHHWGLTWLTIFLFATYNIMDPLHGQIGGLPQTIAGVMFASWGLVLLARWTAPRAGPTSTAGPPNRPTPA
ncbi:MAG: hypothetical protein AAGN82_06750 [Myxococcota bacterium]